MTNNERGPGRLFGTGKQEGFTMLNQSSQHAVRAMSRLAGAGESWVRAKDLAEEADVPFHYLAKLLSQLVRAGILEAVRGKHGGYRLARPADQITLYEVIDTIEPISGPRQCLLARAECNPDNPCRVHSAWAPVIGQVHLFLHQTTLADIAYGSS